MTHMDHTAIGNSKTASRVFQSPPKWQSKHPLYHYIENETYSHTHNKNFRKLLKKATKYFRRKTKESKREKEQKANIFFFPFEE